MTYNKNQKNVIDILLQYNNNNNNNNNNDNTKIIKSRNNA